MQLTDIVTQVRQLMQDDEYDQTLIMNAANWFVYELCSNNRLRIMETSDTLTAAIGDTSVPFPDDYMVWLNLYSTSPTTYNIGDQYVEYGDFVKRYPNFATAARSKAYQWTDFGNAMRFAAPLSVATSIAIDYIREPVPMTDLTDTCEIPGRYIELVAKGTKARLTEIDEDYEYGAAERTLLAPLVTAFIRNEARGGGKTGPTIIRTNRRRRGSEW